MLVAFGDSLSAHAHAWPTMIDQPVIVMAVAGTKVADLPTQIRHAPAASAAVVTVGTNDVLDPSEPIDVLAAHVEALRERYSRVAVVRAFCRPYGRGEHLAWLEPRRTEMLRVLYASGADVLTPKLPQWCWKRDGIHPNRWGHARIARSVRVWLGTRSLADA